MICGCRELHDAGSVNELFRQFTLADCRFQAETQGSIPVPQPVSEFALVAPPRLVALPTIPDSRASWNQ